MNQPNARIIVIGAGVTGSLIEQLLEQNPGAEIITLDEAQSRGLVPNKILFPIENRRSILPAMCFPELVFDEGKKRKSWEPVTFPKNKNKKRR